MTKRGKFITVEGVDGAGKAHSSKSSLMRSKKGALILSGRASPAARKAQRRSESFC